MIQVGDRVKCVDVSLHEKQARPVPLILHRDYLVYDIHTCSCGAISIDVGLTVPPPSPGYVQGVCHCGFCGTTKTISGQPYYFKESRFRKIEPEYKAVLVDSEISEQAKELIGITETIAR